MVSIIEIDKELIPYSFNLELSEKLYKFTAKYNTAFDFFTVDLHLNGEPILFGEKLKYGTPLFMFKRHLDVPKEQIVPVDVNGKETAVTYENLGDSVFLYVVDGEEDV